MTNVIFINIRKHYLATIERPFLDKKTKSIKGKSYIMTTCE